MVSHRRTVANNQRYDEAFQGPLQCAGPAAWPRSPAWTPASTSTRSGAREGEPHVIARGAGWSPMTRYAP